MGSKRNISVLILVALFAVILIPHATVGAQTKTLTVPDQYPTIQAAVKNADAGDTVYVRNGNYTVGEIVINKPISLIGENANTTIINQQQLPYGGVVFTIKADNVTVSGFTIQNYDIGIYVADGYGYPDIDRTSRNCHIQGNKLLNGNHGIWVDGGIGFNIENNTILNNRQWGIYLYPTAINGTVTGNSISGGIGLYYANNITIASNNLTAGGINLQFATQVNIYGNNITDSKGAGIGFGQFSA
jgi:nitrous oxidase accessory protein